MLKQKDLVIFDLDGCIVDSESLYTKLWGRVFEKNNIPITEQQIISWRGLGWPLIREILNTITLDDALSVDLRAQREIMFNQALENGELELKPYAKEVIQHIKSEGLKVAIGTSTFHNKASRILNHFNLMDEFDTVVYGDSVKHTKPHPDIYLKVVESLGFDKERVLIFEDSKTGIKAANNAGIDVIYVPDGPILDLEGVEVVKTINDFSEVM